MSVLIRIALVLGALWSVAVLIAGAAIGAWSSLEWVLIAAALLAPLLHRSGAALALIFFLPVFGNRPGSSQTEALLILMAALQLGTLRLTLKVVPLAMQREALRLLAALCLVGIASLSTIGGAHWYHTLRAQIPSLGDWSAWSFLVFDWATSTEERLPYLLQSTWWLLCSFQIALWIWHHTERDRQFALQLLKVTFFSLQCALLVGFLDYYGVIDLRFWRALDPVVNPGDVQFRLQSWFGHSGWFAEYVTLAAPSVLVVLALPWRWGVRVAALLSALLLGEFALILTFQRGGWLSYPLTLLVVWGAVYVSRRIERGELDILKAVRASLAKIVISLPLTVLLSLFVVWGLGRAGVLGSAGEVDLMRYMERAKDITRTSDRTEFIHTGFLLGTRFPIFGGGTEGFAYHYRREFQHPEGAFYQRYVLPLHGSAHNVYAQTFSGLGGVGLYLLLALLASMFIRPLWATLKDRTLKLPERLVCLSVAASAAAFAIYGNVQEVFYVHALQVLFGAFVGVAAGACNEQPGRSFLPQQWALPALLIGLLLHVGWLWLSPLAPRVDRTYGCYAEEPDGNGGTFQWCGPRALIEIPDQDSEKPSTLVLERAAFGRPNDNSVVKVQLDGEIIAESLLSPGQPVSVSDPRLTTGRLIEIRTAFGAIPQRDIAGSKDRRVLSYQLRFQH